MDGILAIWNDCAASEEADYEQWYMREHFPERLGVPGFRTGRRYEAVAGEPRFFTYYEVDGPAVLVSPAYRERLQNPTPWTRRIMQSAFRRMIRTVCERTASWGDAMGSHVVAVRWAHASAPAAPGGIAAELAQRDGVARVQTWAAAARQTGETAESKARGGDAVIGGALIADCLRRADAEVVAELLASRLDDRHKGAGAPTLGIYALLCLREAKAP
jgi:hypothetical protein